MSANDGARIARKPYSRSAHTACSRDEPHPKFAPVRRIVAPSASGWLSSNSGFKLPSGRNRQSEKSGGTKVWSVSGHVNQPGVYELPMGYDDMEKFIMEDCGGITNGKQLKAVIPGGSSVYIMRADQIVD